MITDCIRHNYKAIITSQTWFEIKAITIWSREEAVQAYSNRGNTIRLVEAVGFIKDLMAVTLYRMHRILTRYKI